MQLFDPNNPNEKKKMIAAGVLGVAAIAVLGYVFFGGSSPKTTTNTRIGTTASPTPNKIARDETQNDDLAVFQKVVYSGTIPAVSEADRNIFAYYVPPPPPVKVVYVPTPTPVPPPPLTASSLMPNSVYARTPADFSLQVTGDKFTPAVHVTIDGRDLPTRFINAQQLFTTVPFALITNPGSRQVTVRSSDGKLYSNPVTLTVTPPPTPNYAYIGIIGKPRFNDTAVLQDKTSKDLVNVQRGDLLGQRFRVSSISEREVVVIDATLKIKHTITFTVDAASPQFRPPVRTSDEEPQL
jgi:hypothetical protein